MPTVATWRLWSIAVVRVPALRCRTEKEQRRTLFAPLYASSGRGGSLTPPDLGRVATSSAS